MDEIDDKVKKILSEFPHDGFDYIQQLMEENSWTFTQALNHFYSDAIEGQGQ